MPNQNYIEAREELKMAQCDLALSYPTCKTEERLCKFAYSAWCPTCDKESPRRRSKSETNEPCRKKGREMKGTPRKNDWNQECENMELEYETKDVRYDTCRIRSNLCELPTTYITNNCQMMKLSSCPSDFGDSAEKSIKCYENNLKWNDFNQFQNFGSMVEKQDRICKLYPRMEESARNINGIVHKHGPKLDNLKPHVTPIMLPSSAPGYLETARSPRNTKHTPKIYDGKKLKPISGTTPSVDALLNGLQHKSPKGNEFSNLEFKNRACTAYPQHKSTHYCSNSRLAHDSYSKISSSNGHVKVAPLNCNVLDLKIHEGSKTSDIHYDTCTFFDKKVDVLNLRERYSREVNILKEKLRDLRNNAYDNQAKAKMVSAPVKHETSIKLPPLHEVSRIINMDLKRLHQLKDTTGAVPKVLSTSRNDTAPEASPPPQIKRDRLKGNSKVSLKTKGKLSGIKAKKPKSKVCMNVGANRELSDSDCSDSEDSDGEANQLDDSESLDDVSVASSVRVIAAGGAAKSSQAGGAGDAVLWPLRQSLFPHIPPYLCFVLHDVLSPQRLPSGARYMKWKMSTITPILVRKTLTNSGFRLVRKSNEWVGTWGKHMKSPMFKTLKDTQKLNHFPGTFQIGRKDRLWRNLQKLMLKHGMKEFGFTPQTYVLPQDLKLLKQQWQNKNGNGDEKYIIKPPASARGTGIKVINRWSQLPKRMSLVVQEYISNPYLINGSKFDLRLYVLVTSFNPLRIYLYPDGLARFASVPYSDDVKDLKDRYMHLTNYSINKMSSMYTANEDANACKGHKWTLSKLWEYMEKQGVDTKALWKNLEQLVIKTLISGESSIVALCRENMNSRYNCYELFGVDVLLDQNLKAWLLEVNISPSLHSQSPLDEHVKGPLVQSLFDLAQFHLPPRLGKIENRTMPPCYDPRLYMTTLTKRERNKHNYFSQTDSRGEYLEDILADLTGDDVRHLTQAEDEFAAMGQFKRIFPTADTHKYFNFLDIRYYNRLFDAWECKYHKNRQTGISILQSLCEQKLHLKIAPPTMLNKSSLNLIPGDPSLQVSKEGHTLPATVTASAAITVTPIQQAVDVDKTSVAPTKPGMDIKSLYNALRIQSERGNMVLRPFPRSSYSTQV